MRGFREVGRRFERIETNLDIDPDERIHRTPQCDIPNFSSGFDVDPDVRIGDSDIPWFADDFAVKTTLGVVKSMTAQMKIAATAHALASRG